MHHYNCMCRCITIYNDYIVINIPHGFPKELRKDVKKELKELIKQGLVLEKHTNYGLHVSLNIKKKKEIEKIIFSPNIED